MTYFWGGPILTKCVRIFGRKPEANMQTTEERLLELAAEEIVSTVLGHGCFPEPKRVGMFLTTGSDKPIRFLLEEFLFDGDKKLFEQSEIEELFSLAIINRAPFAVRRSKHLDKIEGLLTAHFNAQHPLVVEVAEDVRRHEESISKQNKWIAQEYERSGGKV